MDGKLRFTTAQGSEVPIEKAERFYFTVFGGCDVSEVKKWLEGFLSLKLTTIGILGLGDHIKFCYKKAGMENLIPHRLFCVEAEYEQGTGLRDVKFFGVAAPTIIQAVEAAKNAFPKGLFFRECPYDAALKSGRYINYIQ